MTTSACSRSQRAEVAADVATGTPLGSLHQASTLRCSVLRRPDLLHDPRCANNAARVADRIFVDGLVAEVFASLPSAAIIDRLIEAQTAFGNVNSVRDLIEHSQLRTRPMPVHGRNVDVPASPWAVEWEANTFAEAPALNAHGAANRLEFGAAPTLSGIEPP